jgi:hypothetical protein
MAVSNSSYLFIVSAARAQQLDCMVPTARQVPCTLCDGHSFWLWLSFFHVVHEAGHKVSKLAESLGMRMDPSTWVGGSTNRDWRCWPVGFCDVIFRPR